MRAFAWFVGLILVGLASIAVFTYPLWTLLHPHFGFPFHRLGERIGMVVLLLVFAAAAPRLGVGDRVSLGFGLPRRAFLREMATGLALGVLTMAAIVAVMTALGLLEWTRSPHVARLVLMSLSSGLAAALIEETFLRGAMLTAIERESGSTPAVLATAAVYSATHFFASYHIAAAEVTAGSGLDLLRGTLQAFANPGGIADAFLCLFAVGVVLAVIRVVTGNIAACIGLHAGWVWVMLTVHGLSAPVRTAPLRFLLSRFDGFVGWLVLAWTVLIGFALWRFYARGASRSSRATGSSISR